MWKETRLQAAPELGAVGKEQFLRDLEGIRTLLVEPGLILRFSATRPLTAEMSGHSVTLLLELSLQDPRANDEKMVCPGGEAAHWSPPPSGPHRTVDADEGGPGAIVFGQDQ